MRILIAHSRYLSGAASGENQVVEDEARLLREAGHEVEVWDPAARVDRAAEMLRTAFATVWSARAASEIRRRIRERRIEVVHVHNLFPALSPAVIRAAADEEAAVVMTLHNYRLHCLPGTFLRDGKVCELCLGRIPWRGVMYRCYRESAPASAALAASLTLHRAVGTFDRVHLYLAVSDFIRSKHIEGGLDPQRIIVKPNFASATQRREGDGEYFLYLGRLAYEKGVDTVLRCWHKGLGKLLVVGGGPEEESLRKIAPPEAQFLGSVPPTQAREIVRKARALLVPSRWYEGAPRNIIEAYAAGVPVIASRIGGLTEAVDQGATGFLVEPENPSDWAETIGKLTAGSVAAELGEGAYQTWSRLYTPEIGLKQLEDVYLRVRPIVDAAIPSK
jgi:glycosyltransferase involved in cell wall biosynthesis